MKQVVFCLAVTLAQVSWAEDLTVEQEILSTMASWNEGWRTADAALAVRDYADDADWTNAFGDRFQGKKALEEGLAFIFSLDFVMAGTSGESEFRDVTMLNDSVALIRSQLVRRGQKTQSGEIMADRVVNHLRVVVKQGGDWVIKSHLISQAQPKR